MQTELEPGQGAELLALLAQNKLPDERGRYGPFGGC